MDDVIIITGLTVVGAAVWEYTQTPEFKESVKQAWLKSQEKLQKVMTYSEFQILMIREIMITQGGVSSEDIVIGTGENKGTILPLPNSIPDELKPPIHTGNTDTLPEEKPLVLPPTSLGNGKEFEGPIVDPLPEAQDKDDLTTADKNPPKLENNHIYFITAKGTLEVKNNDIPKDYTLNEDGTVIGPKGGEYKQVGYTEDGKVIFVNNKEFFLFEDGEKKAVSSPGTGGIIQTGLTRPPLTKATKDKIEERYIDNGDGTFTHIKTKNIIQGPIDYGHIYSWENRRLIKAAESLGMDQKTFNQYVNSRDNIFQFENHYENVSHENEKPGNGLEKDIVNDMKKFLKE